MAHWQLTLLLIVSLGVALSAQNYQLTNQTQVDNFDQSITNIPEDLAIQTTNHDADPINDLSPLLNIVSIGGHLIISKNDSLMNLEGLNNLLRVEENLEINENLNLINFDGTNNISAIGGSLIITQNTNLNSLDGFSGLDSLGGMLQIDSNQNLVEINAFTLLENIPGELSIEFNPNLNDISGFTNIKTVGGSLFIGSNHAQTNLDGLSSIESVGGRLAISDQTSLQNVNGLSALKFINENLSISSNNALIDLKGFQNLTSIGTDIYIGRNNALKNLDAFSKIDTIHTLNINGNNALISIDGFSNLVHIEDALYIWRNPNLVDLNSFEKLQAIGNEFRILSNNQLINLDGFSNLRYVGEKLDIYQNPQLENLDGLSNIAAVNDLRVTDNDNLTNCCGIQHLILYASETSNPAAITRNSSGCDSPESIVLSKCEGLYYLQGKTQTDINVDGCDENDYVIPKNSFDIFKNSQYVGRLSQNKEQYIIRVDTGHHMVIPVINTELFEVNPDTLFINLPEDSTGLLSDFCLAIIANAQNLNIELVPIGIARPGFTSGYKIIYENTGSETISGTIEFDFQSEKSQFISSTPFLNEELESKLIWNYSDLVPFEKREIKVTMKINSPMDDPPVNDGDFLSYSAFITPIEDDIDTKNNTAPLRQIVVNSFDPNDKTCLLGNKISLQESQGFIPYLIRFENVGSASAAHVIVTDTIDEQKFDMSSIQMIDASHRYAAQIVDNVITIRFDYINLPFNDENNDGYVAFKIKPWSNLVVGDALDNYADIYFDFNFPIRTNTATTIIEEISSNNSTPTNRANLAIFPNPISEELNILCQNGQYKLEISDQIGQILIKTNLTVGNTSTSIDVSHLTSGTYFLRLIGEDGGYSIEQFVKVK